MSKYNCSLLHMVAIYVYIGGYLCIINTVGIIYLLTSFHLDTARFYVLIVLLGAMTVGDIGIALFSDFFNKNCVGAED